MRKPQTVSQRKVFDHLLNQTNEKLSAAPRELQPGIGVCEMGDVGVRFQGWGCMSNNRNTKSNVPNGGDYMNRKNSMNTILKQIQRRAAALPLASQAELLNYAVYLEQKKRKKTSVTSLQLRRECFAAALTQAVALNPFAEISDPVSWQREQRKDRLLPGRNNAD